MIMNSYLNSYYEFKKDFMIMNSYATFHDHEFIFEFMYMKNIVKSYLKSCVPRFQM